MSEVKLHCGVYSEGTVFSVTIARDAMVYDLKKAIARIVSTAQHVVPPRLVKHYFTKKEGAWLKDDDDMDDLLQGEVDMTYPEMIPLWRLNHAAYFGPDFELEDEDIHVLVELPQSADSFPWSRLRVEMNSNAKEKISPYEKVAERLKNAPEVSQLVDAVRYVTKDTYARPFIVLASSSGVGETQMAFNLMAREDIQVHYIVCDCGPGSEFRQDVYTAFDGRLAHGEVLRRPVGLHLHTFEFVRALLSGANATQKAVCSYEEVQKVLERQTKQQVVFIDKFPLLNEDDPNHEVKLRFMRNVFRTLKLPVILSSTNGTARGLIMPGNSHLRGETNVRWCVLVPRMPHFQDVALESLPRDDIKALVQCSRPLFAQFALEFIRDHELPLPPQDDSQQNDASRPADHQLHGRADSRTGSRRAGSGSGRGRSGFAWARSVSF